MDKWDILKLVFGIVLITYLVFGVVDPGKLVSEAVKINIFYLGLAIFAYFLLDSLASIRLYLSIKWIGYKLSMKESFWTHVFGMLWSNITPGRAGYLSVVYSLKKKIKLPVSDGLSLVGLVTSTDFIVKAMGAVLAIIFIIAYLGGGELIFWGSLSIVFVASLPLAFFIVLWKDFPIFDRIMLMIPFFGEKLHKMISDMKAPFRKMKNKIPQLILFAVGLWIIRGIEWTLIGYACNIQLPFLVFFLMHPLLTAIRVIPITPAGLGLFEGMVIIGFSLFGIPPENALLLSFLDRIDNVFVDIISLRELKKI